MHVGGATRITGGAGDNHVQLLGTFNSVDVTTFAGNDTVLLGRDANGHAFQAESVEIHTGAGGDRLNLTGGVVADHFFADLGSGNDALVLNNWDFVRGGTIIGGSGHNTRNLLAGGVHGNPELDGFQLA